MLRFVISLLFLYLVVAGCHHNKTSTELFETFSQNKTNLDLLIDNFKKNKKLDTIFQIGPDSGLPDLKNSYPDIYEMIKKIGITDASSHKNVFPKNTFWYYFKTNWPNEYPIYLIFNAYDSSETKKEFYLKDEVSNETWGLGDNWKMFRLVKFKTMKQ